MSDVEKAKERAFWELVYRGLMMIAKAIKERYLKEPIPEESVSHS